MTAASRALPLDHRPYKMTRLIGRCCEHCYKDFVIREAQLKTSAGRFCSDACRAAFPAISSFRKHVNPADAVGGGCILWDASAGPLGYAQFSAPPKSGIRASRAHVFALLHWLGLSELPEGHVVHHVCWRTSPDSRRCVNLSHLRLVEKADHMSLHRGRRHQRGALRLSPGKVKLIRFLSADGMTRAAIAAALELSWEQVDRCLSGKTFSKVEGMWRPKVGVNDVTR